MEKKQDSKKLTLNKETLQQLKIKSDIKGGVYSRGVGGCSGATGASHTC